MHMTLTLPFSLSESYKDAALDSPIRQCIGHARTQREGIEHISRASETIMALLDNGRPVLVQELSGIINKAEGLGLVSRAGMKVSGLYFVLHENEIARNAVNLHPEEGKAVALHLYKEASRALHILENPNGYTPRRCYQLYGGLCHKDWTPLIP